MVRTRFFVGVVILLIGAVITLGFISIKYHTVLQLWNARPRYKFSQDAVGAYRPAPVDLIENEQELMTVINSQIQWSNKATVGAGVVVTTKGAYVISMQNLTSNGAVIEKYINVPPKKQYETYQFVPDAMYKMTHMFPLDCLLTDNEVLLVAHDFAIDHYDQASIGAAVAKENSGQLVLIPKAQLDEWWEVKPL